LNKFVGTIQKFNRGHKTKFVEHEIYSFFHHRWQNDRNFAIATEEDRQILEQLPSRHIQNLYCNYLFKDFMDEFKSLFEVKAQLLYRRMITYREKDLVFQEKVPNKIDLDKLFSDEKYDDFLIKFLMTLEPFLVVEDQDI